MTDLLSGDLDLPFKALFLTFPRLLKACSFSYLICLPFSSLSSILLKPLGGLIEAPSSSLIGVTDLELI